MEGILIFIIVLCLMTIFFAMIGYPLLLIVIDKLKKPGPLAKNADYEPDVTLMIAAHNEEDVIERKLQNALALDYPHDKLHILVASDSSTDGTNDLVTKFMAENPNRRIRLYKTLEHKGKTSAQNEAQKTVDSELLMMTDANTMLRADAVRQLVSSFSADDIEYVCGALIYTNTDVPSGDSESTYWNIDLRMRDIESRLQTITAGNGAIYACRNASYYDFAPELPHDIVMPLRYALQGKRAVYNPNAIGYEKTAGTAREEYARKVRISRIVLPMLGYSIKTMNFVRYRWFSLFYFGHRTCRYLLWLSHLLCAAASAALALTGNAFAVALTVLQLLFALITAAQWRRQSRNRLLRMAGYYGMTIAAQLTGVARGLRGQKQATWEGMKSTR